MSHDKLPVGFALPERPWNYSHADIAALARAHGIVEEEAIADEIRGWALGEWMGTLHIARRRSATFNLDQQQWEHVLDHLRARHIESWGSYSDA